MLIIGWWVTRQIENGVMNRTASVTASFVTGALATHLQDLDQPGDLSPTQLDILDGLLSESDLGHRIVSFKVWSPKGRILYSPEPALVGRVFPMNPDLRLALAGETVTGISDLTEEENVYERLRYSRLLETYTPLRVPGSGEITGAVEFYEGTGELMAEIQAARVRTWLVIGGATLAMYLLLVGMVKGASATIIQQRRQLEQRVDQLDAAATHNQRLNRQLSTIAAVATKANETSELATLLSHCLEVTLEHTSMEGGVIALEEGLDQTIRVVGEGHHTADVYCFDQISGLGDPIFKEAVSSGVPLYIGPGDEREDGDSGYNSPLHPFAILPLRSAREVMGVLYLCRHHGEAPDSEERETLEAIAHQIASAVENIRLTDELSRLQAQRELDRLKSEFISAVSHELRTPLGFIKGYATTLMRDDIEIALADQKEFLQIIDEESEKLRRMLEDLLDASRLQAGRFQLSQTIIGLNEFLHRVLDQLKSSLNGRSQNLVFYPLVMDSNVLIDPGRIEQVLRNLVDNAAHHSKSGATIEVHAEAQEHQVVIGVKDSGDGIPQEEWEKIFEPFYRGGNPRERSDGGTGLGLAISRGIVESHRGSIWLDSTLGEGSTFYFTLPHAELSDHQEIDASNYSEEQV
jgi:signal transduction histidine kinase